MARRLVARHSFIPSPLPSLDGLRLFCRTPSFSVTGSPDGSMILGRVYLQVRTPLRALLVGAILSWLPFAGHCQAQVESPVYGRPRYEVVDGKEWRFILHQQAIDWYATTSQLEWTEHGFKLLVRSVEPATIGFGPLEINCSERQASVYYEAFEPVDLGLDNLVTRLFRGHCPASGK